MDPLAEWNDLLNPGAATDFFLPGPMPAFKLVEDRFDPALALWLSEFSRLSYRAAQSTEAGAFLTRAQILLQAADGWSELYFFDGLAKCGPGRPGLGRPPLPADDTQALLAQNPGANCLVLAFRGTSGFFDLLTDLGFLATPSRSQLKGSAHYGFQLALDSIWPEVLELLAQTSGKIILTGHSLGGALATLAAARLLREKERAFSSRLACLYTFGSPRVGTPGFEENLHGVYHARIVHEDDLVTQLPPAFAIPPFPRYKHLGSLHCLASSGEIQFAFPENHDVEGAGGGIFETQRMLQRIFNEARTGKFGPPIKSLRDHTPLLYTKALRAALARTPPK